jgi:hypothetical protein
MLAVEVGAKSIPIISERSLCRDRHYALQNALGDFQVMALFHNNRNLSIRMKALFRLHLWWRVSKSISNKLSFLA